MTSTPPSSESPVWSGTPSQWLNFETFSYATLLIAGILVGAYFWSRPIIAAFAVVPAAVAFWKWLTLKCTRIDVTTERISTRTGVFSRERSDMELYRVKDTALQEPFLLRIVGLSNIALVSSDKTTPNMLIPGIRDGEALRQQLRQHIERMRVLRNVREFDSE